MAARAAASGGTTCRAVVSLTARWTRRYSGCTDCGGDLEHNVSESVSWRQLVILTHRRKIQMLSRSATELTTVRTSLADAMARC